MFNYDNKNLLLCISNKYYGKFVEVIFGCYLFGHFKTNKSTNRMVSITNFYFEKFAFKMLRMNFTDEKRWIFGMYSNFVFFVNLFTFLENGFEFKMKTTKMNKHSKRCKFFCFIFFIANDIGSH